MKERKEERKKERKKERKEIKKEYKNIQQFKKYTKIKGKYTIMFGHEK